MSKLGCVACWRDSEIHHILSQKAYPEFRKSPWNKINLCREHHSEWHSRAATFMATKYFPIKIWLFNKGWEYCETKQKYVPPLAKEDFKEETEV